MKTITISIPELTEAGAEVSKQIAEKIPSDTLKQIVVEFSAEVTSRIIAKLFGKFTIRDKYETIKYKLDKTNNPLQSLMFKSFLDRIKETAIKNQLATENPDGTLTWTEDEQLWAEFEKQSDDAPDIPTNFDLN